MSFPKRGQIFKDSVDRIKSTVARPSLDTFYEVNFSFGKYQTWLSDAPGKRRTQGTDFMQKMSLMCTQAELPGTSFVPSSAIGHRQGIQEEFPNLRNFPPLNLVFYCDADHVILEVLESWMSYITGDTADFHSENFYYRIKFPNNYKGGLEITKFEKNLHSQDPIRGRTRPLTYTFINVFPKSIASIPVTYDASDLLKCTVTFNYSRYSAKPANNNANDPSFAYLAGKFANIAVDKLTGVDLLGDVVGGVVQRSLSN